MPKICIRAGTIILEDLGRHNMCGIAGILDISRGRSLRDLISQMNDKQRHRGQDDGGTYFDDGLVIGHNRLSIIDTSPVGHQPMEINNGELVIVFNGEIYNYVELKEQLVSLDRKSVV